MNTIFKFVNIFWVIILLFLSYISEPLHAQNWTNGSSNTTNFAPQTTTTTPPSNGSPAPPTITESYNPALNNSNAVSSSSSFANQPARDGAYDKITTRQKQILAYPSIREADVFWQKRVWRVIDTKQKMNLALMYPKQPLISTLLEIVKNNPEKARIFMDDEFKNPISIEDINARLGTTDTITVIDPETYQETKKVVSNDFDWTTVTKFRLKEDWIFDKQRSQMVVRILAIAPIRDVIDDNGNYRGQEAMFYAYYPDFRQFLVKYDVFNPNNDAQQLSWDDIFEMRYFSSYIIKESNMFDRRIQEYASGRDALLESERIKNELFEKEHSLWSY